MAKSFAELRSPTMGNDGPAEVFAHDKTIVRIFIIAGMRARPAETQDRLGTAGNNFEAGIPVTDVIRRSVQIEKLPVPNHGRGKA
jgi:hypothetical protein